MASANAAIAAMPMARPLAPSMKLTALITTTSHTIEPMIASAMSGSSIVTPGHRPSTSTRTPNAAIAPVERNHDQPSARSR